MAAESLKSKALTHQEINEAPHPDRLSSHVSFSSLKTCRHTVTPGKVKLTRLPFLTANNYNLLSKYTSDDKKVKGFSALIRNPI